MSIPGVLPVYSQYALEDCGLGRLAGNLIPVYFCTHSAGGTGPAKTIIPDKDVHHLHTTRESMAKVIRDRR